MEYSSRVYVTIKILNWGHTLEICCDEDTGVKDVKRRLGANGEIDGHPNFVVTGGSHNIGLKSPVEISINPGNCDFTDFQRSNGLIPTTHRLVQLKSHTGFLTYFDHEDTGWLAAELYVPEDIWQDLLIRQRNGHSLPKSLHIQAIGTSVSGSPFPSWDASKIEYIFITEFTFSYERIDIFE